MDPGDADVGDVLDLGPEDAGGERRLGGDRCVGGAGGHDADPTGGRRQLAEHAGARDLVDVGGRELRGDGGQRSVGEPGGQRRPLTVGLAQRAEQVDDLLGRLAGAVDDLGVAGAGGAVGVEPGEPEVDVARSRRRAPTPRAGEDRRLRPVRPARRGRTGRDRRVDVLVVSAGRSSRRRRRWRSVRGRPARARVPSRAPRRGRVVGAPSDRRRCMVRP